MEQIKAMDVYRQEQEHLQQQMHVVIQQRYHESVTWTADVTPPVFTGSYATVDLGCNPTNIKCNT